MTKVRRHHVVWSLLIGLMCANNASGDFSDLEKEILDVQKFMIRKLLPLAQDAIVDTETSASCAGAMLKLLNGIRNREAWALKCKSSSTGILTYNHAHINKPFLSV